MKILTAIFIIAITIIIACDNKPTQPIIDPPVIELPKVTLWKCVDGSLFGTDPYDSCWLKVYDTTFATGDTAYTPRGKAYIVRIKWI